jgi:tetratricopeptide (TPR) repeat protein
VRRSRALGIYCAAVHTDSVRSIAFALLFSLALGSAFACGPRDPLERARVLQDKEQNFAKSLEPLREALAKNPDDPEANYRYGLALLASGQTSLAKWSLRKALDSPEWLERAGIPLATTAIQLGGYDEAVEIATRVLAQHPDNVDALMLRADARIRTRRQYEEALADAERALELDPENHGAMVPKVAALLGLERADEAAAALDSLERAYSDEKLGLHGSPALCTARATFAKEKGDLETAGKRFDECLEHFATDGTVLREAVTFFDSTKKSEHSEEILKTALEKAPNAFGYRAELVERYRATGRESEAEALLRAATELEDPASQAVGWSSVALYSLEKGQFDEAAKAFERARAIDPTGSTEILFGYADALVLAGQHDEALRIADQMAVPAHRSLVKGRVALERGDPKQALEHFSEGNRLWPNNAVARYYAATAAEQLGDFERAIEEYRYAMRIDVRATDAYLRLARLQSAAGQHELALATLEFSPGGRPEEEAAALFELELAARMNRVPPPSVLQRLQRERRPAAAAALARGFAARLGAKQGVQFLRSQSDIDLTDPENADALAAWVELSAASGSAREGLSRAEAAIAKHPESAAFHALRGRALAAAGSDDVAVRAAYQRALEIDPEEHRALVGLAALEAKGGAREAALALYERAARADTNDRETARTVADLLAQLGRRDEGEARLGQLLREHPYDAQAAIALAELRQARGAERAGTEELARRAVKFGGGEPAKALLDKIEEEGGATTTASPAKAKS